MTQMTAFRSLFRLGQILPKHDPMPIHSTNSKFTHSPGFVAQVLNKIGVVRSHPFVFTGRIINNKISEVRMIPQLCR